MHPFPPSRAFSLAIFGAGNVPPTVPSVTVEIIDSGMLSGLGNTQKARSDFFPQNIPLPVSTWTQGL